MQSPFGSLVNDSMKLSPNHSPVSSVVPSPSTSPCAMFVVSLKIFDCGKVGMLKRGNKEIQVKIVKRVAGDALIIEGSRYVMIPRKNIEQNQFESEVITGKLRLDMVQQIWECVQRYEFERAKQIYEQIILNGYLS